MSTVNKNDFLSYNLVEDKNGVFGMFNNLEIDTEKLNISFTATPQTMSNLCPSTGCCIKEFKKNLISTIGKEEAYEFLNNVVTQGILYAQHAQETPNISDEIEKLNILTDKVKEFVSTDYYNQVVSHLFREAYHNHIQQIHINLTS